MKSILIDLSPLWNNVIKCFSKLTDSDDNKAYSFDVHLATTCWLTQRIYEKTGSICFQNMDIVLPFYLEKMIFHFPEGLLDEYSELKIFDDYLTFLNLSDYKLTVEIDIKVIHRNMVITKL